MALFHPNFGSTTLSTRFWYRQNSSKFFFRTATLSTVSGIAHFIHRGTITLSTGLRYRHQFIQFILTNFVNWAYIALLLFYFGSTKFLVNRRIGYAYIYALRQNIILVTKALVSPHFTYSNWPYHCITWSSANFLGIVKLAAMVKSYLNPWSRHHAPLHSQSYGLIHISISIVLISLSIPPFLSPPFGPWPKYYMW